MHRCRLKPVVIVVYELIVLFPGGSVPRIVKTFVEIDMFEDKFTDRKICPTNVCSQRNNYIANVD